MPRANRPPEPCPETLPLSFEPLTVRVPVAVRLTGVGRSKLYELIRDGTVQTVKVGSSTLVKMDSLRRLTGTSEKT